MNNKRIEFNNKIDKYFEALLSNERYDFNEAKNIYLKLLSTNNLEEKLKLRNKLVSGTLYKVSEHLKNNLYQVLENSYINIEDIINDYIVIYIELIDKGIYLSSSKSFSSIFYMAIERKLLSKYGKSIIYNRKLKLDIIGLLYWYVENSSIREIEYNDFYIFCKNNKEFYDDYMIAKIYNFFKYVYCKFDECGINKDNIITMKRFLKYMIVPFFETGNFQDYLMVNNKDLILEFGDKELEIYIKTMIASLDGKYKYIIEERYNNDKGSMSLEQIGKKLNLSKSRIQSLEMEALNKLYKSNYKVLKNLRNNYDGARIRK